MKVLPESAIKFGSFEVRTTINSSGLYLNPDKGKRQQKGLLRDWRAQKMLVKYHQWLDFLPEVLEGLFLSALASFHLNRKHHF